MYKKNIRIYKKCAPDLAESPDNDAGAGLPSERCNDKGFTIIFFNKLIWKFGQIQLWSNTLCTFAQIILK